MGMRWGWGAEPALAGPGGAAAAAMVNGAGWLPIIIIMNMFWWFNEGYWGGADDELPLADEEPCEDVVDELDEAMAALAIAIMYGLIICGSNGWPAGRGGGGMLNWDAAADDDDEDEADDEDDDDEDDDEADGWDLPCVDVSFVDDEVGFGLEPGVGVVVFTSDLC